MKKVAIGYVIVMNEGLVVHSVVYTHIHSMNRAEVASGPLLDARRTPPITRFSMAQHDFGPEVPETPEMILASQAARIR